MRLTKGRAKLRSVLLVVMVGLKTFCSASLNTMRHYFAINKCCWSSFFEMSDLLKPADAEEFGASFALFSEKEPFFRMF